MAFFGTLVPAQSDEDGAETRIRALMATHFDFVWRSLRRLGLSVSEADAGAREVFVRVSRKLGAISSRTETRALFETMLRVAARRRGSKRRVASQFGGVDEIAPARHDLNEILGAMALEQCAVFMLYELEEMSTPEIAGLLGVSVETVCSRLQLAREEFDSALRRRRARDSSGVKA